MRTTQHQDHPQAKQRLRSEINSHIADFLHRGGRIDVVVQLPTCKSPVRLSHRPAAAELTFGPDIYGE